MNAQQITNGSTVHFHDLPGQGRPLVFVHGLGCASSSDYPKVATHPMLIGRRRILIDLLGFGFSEQPLDFSYSMTDHARAIHDLLERLGLTDFDLYGHSMGGTIAIELADMCEDSVQHLVLSEPNLDSGGGTFSKAIQDYSESEYVTTGHEDNIQSAIESDNFVWAGSMRVASAHAVHRSACSLVDGTQPSWRETLTQLSLPRTVIFGEQSLPDDDYMSLTDIGIEVKVVSNAGHSMAWENPSGLAAAISTSCDQRSA